MMVKLGSIMSLPHDIVMSRTLCWAKSWDPTWGLETLPQKCHVYQLLSFEHWSVPQSDTNFRVGNLKVGPEDLPEFQQLSRPEFSIPGENGCFRRQILWHSTL